MTVPSPSLCITCGLDAGPSSSLNRLEDGRPCPTCCERLLDSLPPLLPGFGHLAEAQVPARRVAQAVRAAKLQLGSEKRLRRGRKGNPE